MSEQKPTTTNLEANPMIDAMRRGLSVQELIEGGAQLVLTDEQIEALRDTSDSDVEDQPRPVDTVKVGKEVVALTLHDRLERQVMDIDQSDVNHEADNIRTLHEKIDEVIGQYPSTLFEHKIPLAKFNKKTRFKKELIRDSTPVPPWDVGMQRGILETKNNFQLHYLPDEIENTVNKVELKILTKQDTGRGEEWRLQQNMGFTYGVDGKISIINVGGLDSDLFKAVAQESPESREALAKLAYYFEKTKGDMHSIISIDLTGDTPSIVHSVRPNEYSKTGKNREIYRYEYSPRENLFELSRGTAHEAAVSVETVLGAVEGLLKYMPTDAHTYISDE